MKCYRLFTIVIAFFLSFTLSCAPSATRLSGDKTRLPESFKGYTGGILIEEYNKYNTDFTGRAREAFEKYYKGKFVVVKEVSGAYDKEEFRFAVTYLYSPGTTTSYSSAGVYIYDRKTQEDHRIARNLSVLEALAIAMEEQRGK